ncbi:CapA family protein [soil metagenome]
MRSTIILVAAVGIGAGLLASVGFALADRYSAQPQSVTPAMLSPTVQPTSTPSPTPTPTPESAKTVTLLFGGDVMLGRTVEERIDAHGATWPFASIALTMAGADFTVVNLESPFKEDHARTAINSLVLRGDPKGIAGLTLAGVDLVSLANNHITDMGKAGLSETEALLDGAKIGRTGAGGSTALAEVPYITEVGGLKLGFVSAAYGVNFDSSGVYYNTATPKWVTEQVASLKAKTDAVVFLCHCGTEYAASANTMQQEVAHAAIDAGASLVIGHHPHVPQPVEVYKEGLIIYSLGNLVFDQLQSGNRNVSALAKITLQGAKPTTLQLLPYQIFEYGQPRLTTDTAKKEAVWNLFKLPTGTWP